MRLVVMETKAKYRQQPPIGMDMHFSLPVEMFYALLTCVTTPVLISSPNTLKMIFFISSGGRGLQKYEGKAKAVISDVQRPRHDRATGIP